MLDTISGRSKGHGKCSIKSHPYNGQDDLHSHNHDLIIWRTWSFKLVWHQQWDTDSNPWYNADCNIDRSTSYWARSPGYRHLVIIGVFQYHILGSSVSILISRCIDMTCGLKRQVNADIYWQNAAVSSETLLCSDLCKRVITIDSKSQCKLWCVKPYIDTFSLWISCRERNDLVQSSVL